MKKYLSFIGDFDECKHFDLLFSFFGWKTEILDYVKFTVKVFLVEVETCVNIKRV